MKKFCPKCGKSIDKGSLCKSCEEVNLEFKPIKIKLCPSKRVFHKGSWTKYSDLRKLTEKLLKDNVKSNVKLIEGLEVHKEILEKNGFSDDVDVLVEFEKEEYPIPINVEVTVSPSISKLGSIYFEGILQLRNATKEAKEYVKNYVEKNKSKNVFVNNVVEKKDSVDYYMVSKKHIEPLALKIVRNFGGLIDANAQLFSYNSQTSKDIFRLNTLVTLPKFVIGDVVIKDDRLVKITGTSKIITGTNLLLGKKYAFTLNDKEINDIVPIKKHKVRITKIRPQLEIMDPVNYESVHVKNMIYKPEELRDGKKVSIVEYKGQYYLC